MVPVRTAGQDASWDGDFPGYRRVYAHDPFGTRLGFLEASSVRIPLRHSGPCRELRR